MLLQINYEQMQLQINYNELNSNVNDIKTETNGSFDNRKILISKRNKCVYYSMINYQSETN